MLCMRSLVRFLNIMHIQLLVFPRTYQYVPSTYWYILVKVLELQVQTSTYSVGTVPQWHILRYTTKPLVLVCSGTYFLVMHVTILRISTFLFGTWYIWICTAQEAVQIQMYQVPNQNVEVLRIVTCITRRYVPLQTSTSGFV
jgi:hypothetical protein